MPGSPRPHRYVRVAEAIRDQIRHGHMKPGELAPSGAALARVTGFSALTCRRALELLVAEGTLRPGPSRNARPRVPDADPAALDLADRAAALSGALAERRRAAGCTQAELAEIAGYSETTVGHAETGRLWQSRTFWESADKILDACGELLLLHDAYDDARNRPAASVPPGPTADADTDTGAVAPPAPAPAPVSVTITWPDGTTTTVRQPPATST